jgi:4-hydroxy-4-methyl-2-oxoglutarate aldolase
MKMVSWTAAACALAIGTIAAPASAQVTMTKERMLYYTSEYTGERFPDGRPRLADALLERAAAMTMEDVWDELRSLGYLNQYEGGDWRALHIEKPMVGRAMTTQFMPMRPDVTAAMRKEGQSMGLTNLSNNGWPIAMLQTGDVWVADGYGKVVEGTLIGSNLGSAIASKTKAGFVFDAAIRDEAQNSEFPNFNGWYRAQDPSGWAQMQLMSVNAPIHIGRATVLPGDLVLANKQGVIFIPAQLAEQVVSKAEFTALRDAYNFEMNRSGKNGTTFEGGWDADKYKAFSAWISQRPKMLKMSRSRFDELVADAQRPKSTNP